jgi:hypothetical protein
MMTLGIVEMGTTKKIKSTGKVIILIYLEVEIPVVIYLKH